jgi:biotin carboxylase
MKVAIVDGYSTGRLLVQILHAQGARCIHVRSLADMPAYFTNGFRAADYEVDLGYVPDRAQLVSELRALGIQRVVAGTESGVILADTLSVALGTPGNTDDAIAARRDKELMTALVSAAGLATPRSSAHDDADAATNWFTASGLPDAVVKPLHSAGTDHVSFCTTADAVRRAADGVLASRNLYQERNRRVLVQQRVHGTEYYANTVSHEGTHRIAELWRYVKQDANSATPVYDYEEPVDMRSALADVLRDFVFAALDALGIRTSAAHTEVMLTTDGPVFIETGARLGGATLPHLVRKFSGVSQTTMFADAIMDPDRLIDFDDRQIRWGAAVRSVAMVNPVAGTVRSLDWLHRMESLPTAVAAVSSLSVGDAIGPTTDLISSPGFVYLAAEDPDEVERDYWSLRRLERERCYTS